MSDRSERLAEVLEAHIYWPSPARGIERCYCGESAIGQPGWHRAHLADALAGMLAEARAEAWDEGYDAAAWRSYRRTDISIGRADEANPPNPYRATRPIPPGSSGGGE